VAGRGVGEVTALLRAWHAGDEDAYDVSPDGDRVYFLQREREQTRDKIGVVVGWRALVR